MKSYKAQFEEDFERNLEGIIESVFEGSVEQRLADLCFCRLSRAKLSQAVFLKAQQSKAWHLLCSLAQ